MLSKIRAYYEVKVWDAKGKIIKRERRLSHSFVKQYLEILLSQMIATAISIKDISGSDQTPNPNLSGAHINLAGPANNDNYGIVIGTDNTAVAIADYQLAVQIAVGTGGGQMVHALQSKDTTVTVSAPDATFETDRNFNNNSGAQITVAEIGIYIMANGPTYFCIIRDIPSPLAVPNGGGCNVKYTFKITV